MIGRMAISKLSRGKIVVHAIEPHPGKSSVNKSTTTKRVELYTIDGCTPCDWAKEDLRPIINRKKIPLIVIDDELVKRPPGVYTFPLTCIVNEVNGVEETTCIKGYSPSSYIKDLEKLIH